MSFPRRELYALADVGTGEAWKTHAECEGEPAELFFPEPGRGGTVSYLEAERICARCVVRVHCLAYALEHHISHGMWGGKSERERARIRRRRTA